MPKDFQGLEKKEGRELERPHDALQLDIKKNNPNWFEPPPLRSFRRPQGGGPPFTERLCQKVQRLEEVARRGGGLKS